MIGWNVWKIISYHIRTRRFVKASARVVNISCKKAGDFDLSPYTYFTPIIEFTASDGKKYVLEYAQDNPDRPLYKIGEALTICYDPEEPRRFMIYDPKAEYLVAGAWIVVGVGIIYLMFFFDFASKPPF